MKFRPLFSALILLSIQAFSQSKNNISVVYGFAANDVNIHGAIGDYGYRNKTGTVYGLTYTRNINKIFSIETGLLYSVNKIQLSTIGGYGERFYDQDLKMLSVPVYAKITFLKYLFAQGGVSIDHNLDYSSNSIIQDQSGVGLILGIGVKYSFGPVAIFANPYLVNHAFYARNNLMEAGVKLGVGYNF
jgi:hypothetical protein